MVAMTPPRDETATAPAPTLRNTGKVEPESAANEVQNGRARIAGEDIKYIKTNAFLLPTKSDKEDQKPAPTTKTTREHILVIYRFLAIRIQLLTYSSSAET
jgi:hypothetical protein